MQLLRIRSLVEKSGETLIKLNLVYTSSIKSIFSSVSQKSLKDFIRIDIIKNFKNSKISILSL